MADSIPLIEPVVGDEELENVKDVLDSGYMTQGPYAEQFEEKFAELTGADHAITATSCTTGLELVLEALDIGQGDEVIVPDFTHPASANAVVHVDAEPVLVDVDKQTYNIDPEAVREAVTDKTGAIMPVSWGGQPLDPAPLVEVADEYDVPIVEDAACSAGAAYNDEPVGSQFTASIFSFHPRKVLTTGEGGMITVNDQELADSIRKIKNFGTNPRQSDVGFERASATNFRLSDVLAAIGVAQLDKADEIIERRRELAHNYTELLADIEGVTSPTEPENTYHTYQSYCVFVDSGNGQTRDQLIDELAEEGIETQIGTHALHNTEAFTDAKQVGDLAAAAALEQNLLTLPVAHSMTEAEQERVVTTLDMALDRYRQE